LGLWSCLEEESNIPTRSKTSFNKRQKEQQRKERSIEKIARRQKRKDEKQIGPDSSDPDLLSPEQEPGQEPEQDPEPPQS
jgi:hypothetical protein